MKKYVIREGASFRMPDGSIKRAGETIELPSDVVQANPNAVDEVVDPAPEADATPAAA